MPKETESSDLHGGIPAPGEVVNLVIPSEADGVRIDSWLASRFEKLSRSRINTAIRRGLVTVLGKRVKPSDRFASGTSIRFEMPDLPPEGPVPEDVPLEILHEDEQIVVINKPPGMVVHPARGHWSGTLTAALAFRYLNLSGVGGAHRPGIVHRLDRDTSGVIVVARNDIAHAALTRQFEQRTVEKEYLAIVSPAPGRDRDEIEKPIGIHPFQREKMMVRDDHSSSRPASTFYEVRSRHGRFAVVACFPKTGRTHQIRVHMAAIGSPVIADKLYGGRGWIERSEITGNRADTSRILERQALHAARLKLRHPENGEWIEFRAPIPDDIQRVLNAIRAAGG